MDDQTCIRTAANPEQIHSIPICGKGSQRTEGRELLCSLLSLLSPLLLPLKIKTTDLCLPLRRACNSVRVLLSLDCAGTILQQSLEVRKKEEKVEGHKTGGYIVFYLASIH